MWEKWAKCTLCDICGTITSCLPKSNQSAFAFRDLKNSYRVSIYKIRKRNFLHDGLNGCKKCTFCEKSLDMVGFLPA